MKRFSPKCIGEIALLNNVSFTPDGRWSLFTARTANVDARTLTDCMLAFCKRIEEGGRDAMVYFNTEQSMIMFNIEEVTEYPFWLAMYSDWMTYPYKIHMWQYTNKGKVPGIQGNVDINLAFSYE